MGAIFYSGDDLSERHLQEALGRAGISNYVQWGLSLTVDYGNAVMDVTAGKAFLLHNDRDVTVLADAVAGEPLGTDGTNYVYLTVDEDAGEETYRVVQSRNPPNRPSLLVAEIDMGAQTVTETNRATPVTNATNFKGNDIDANGDGTVNRADWANNVQGANVEGELSNINTRYDSDGDGTVDAAGTVDHVDGADVDGQVAQAGNADTVGGEPPSNFADANHGHPDYIDAGEEDSLDVATAERAGTADRFQGFDPREFTGNSGVVGFPGVALGGSDPDNWVFAMRSVREGHRMELSRAHVCQHSGGGVSGVRLEVTNVRTGDTYEFTGHRKVGSFYSFPSGAIRFELINTSGSQQTASANVHYVIRED